ncbi:MAG: HAD family hydrolase [Dehalococcoidia bacterium]
MATVCFKLAVLDIDGTLLDPNGAISDRVRRAVRAAVESGCLVTLASGRRLWAARGVAAELGIATPLILYNGGLVFDLAAERALYQAPLTASATAQAVDLIWSSGYLPVVFENPLQGERIFTGPQERQNRAADHYLNRRQLDTVRLDQAILRAIPHPLLLATMADEDEMRRLEKQIQRAGIECQTLVERQTFIPGSCWWQLDVMAPGCTKGSALLHLCEQTGILPQETLAIGDGINDLELIRAAGLGIAMGNAVAEVRAAAVHVVSDNAHDGVAEAVERYVLRDHDSLATV